MPRSPQSPHLSSLALLLSPHVADGVLLTLAPLLYIVMKASLSFSLSGTAQMQPLKCIKAQNNSLSLLREGKKCLPTVRVLANISVHLVLLKMESVFLCLLSKKSNQKAVV